VHANKRRVKPKNLLH